MIVERVKGIEPSYAAWEAAVLPLNYTRNFNDLICFCESIWHGFGTGMNARGQK